MKIGQPEIMSKNLIEFYEHICEFFPEETDLRHPLRLCKALVRLGLALPKTTIEVQNEIIEIRAD